MGWGGGNDVFDAVAVKVLKLPVSDEQKTGVLTTLIDLLQDQGWDAEGESLSRFLNWEPVVEAFGLCDVYSFEDD